MDFRAVNQNTAEIGKAQCGASGFLWWTRGGKKKARRGKPAGVAIEESAVGKLLARFAGEAGEARERRIAQDHRARALVLLVHHHPVTGG